MHTINSSRRMNAADISNEQVVRATCNTGAIYMANM